MASVRRFRAGVSSSNSETQQVVQKTNSKESREEISRQRETISDWKQAEDLFFKIRSGKKIRYDPRSSVGRKINELFKRQDLARKSIQFAEQKIAEQKAVQKAREGYDVTATQEGYIIEKESDSHIENLVPNHKQDAKEKLVQQVQQNKEVQVIHDVQPVPTFKQRFKQEPVRTLLDYTLLEKPTEFIEKSQQRGILKQTGGRTYGSADLGFVPKVARTGVYFTPAGVGAGLLIAEGTESYVSKKGRERLKYTATEFKDQYNIPKLATYSLPAVEVGLGVVGLKGVSKVRKVSRELRAFEKAPTYVKGTRLEGSKGGVDILRGVKKTEYATYRTAIKQPFYRAKKSITLEGGEGFALRTAKKSKTQFVEFESMGRVRKIKTTPKLVQIKADQPMLFNQITATKQLKGLEVGVGKISLIKKTKGTINIKRVLSSNLKNLDIHLDYKKIKIKTPEKISETYIGLAKQSKGKIAIVGTKPEQLAFSKLTGKLSIRGKPKTFGVIEKVKLGKDSGFKSFKGGGSKTKLITEQKLEVGTSSYAQPLIKKSFEQVLPKIEKHSPSYIIGGRGGSGSVSSFYGKGGSGTEQIQYIQPSTIPMVNQNLKVPLMNVEQKPITFASTRSIISSQTKQSSNLALNIKQLSKQDQKLKQRQLQENQFRQVTKQSQTFKQPQKLREGLKLKYGSGTVTSSTVIAPPVTITGIPIVPLPKLNLKAFSSTKKKKKEEYPSESLFISAGFTGQKLGIIQPIKLKNLKSTALKQSGLGIRGIPKVIK